VRNIVAEELVDEINLPAPGHMSFGPAESFSPEHFAHLYDINSLSSQRVNRAALRNCANRVGGLLLWVSSSSTRGGTSAVPGTVVRGQRQRWIRRQCNTPVS
jgi:NAD(P)-dependent dehydrogenase (short-subunit alcohol dehydrogenase family)